MYISWKTRVMGGGGVNLGFSPPQKKIWLPNHKELLI